MDVPGTVHGPVFATPDEVESAFYEALEQGDVDALMRTWADDEEIVCIASGGSRQVGVHAVRAAWQQLLAGGAVAVRPLRLHVMQSMMSSVHSLLEQRTAVQRPGLAPVTCYATNVYHKGPAGWRLVLHHASPAADQEQAALLRQAPDILH